jgi:phage recombination protein Bet
MPARTRVAAARPAPENSSQGAGLCSQSAIVTLAERLGVQPTEVFLSSLRNVAFRDATVSTEQLLALVVVANQYQLNPFTRELFAFPQKPEHGGGIVPVVSIDGWLRIINEHAENDGLVYEPVLSPDGELIGGRATIYRKDRKHPTVITELLSECRRATDPWRTMPSRQIRHKAIIQCARVAFGFAGIYDPDEAERIVTAAPAAPNSRPASGADAARRFVEAADAEMIAEGSPGGPAAQTPAGVPPEDPGRRADAEPGQDEMPV